MNSSTKEIEKIDLVSKDRETQIWCSKLETWNQQFQFMRGVLLRYSHYFFDQNHALELRAFNNRLKQAKKEQLEWLNAKAQLHQNAIRSHFKGVPLTTASKVNIDHDFFKKQITGFEIKHEELRDCFFQLVKPVLRKKRMEGIQGKAA